MDYLEKLDLQTEEVEEVEKLEKHTIINSNPFTVDEYIGHDRDFLAIDGEYVDGFNQLGETNGLGISCIVSKEVKEAREDVNGVYHKKLKDRIDSEVNGLNGRIDSEVNGLNGRIDNEVNEINSSLDNIDRIVSDMVVPTKNYEHLIINNDYALAINGAINDIKNIGGKVLITKKECEIKSTIIVPSKITLSGVGSGETALLSKTTIIKNFNGIGIKIHGKNVKLEDFLLTKHNNLSDDVYDGIVIGDENNNASRCIINNVIVNSMGGNGITLKEGNGAEINAKCYANGGNGFSIEPLEVPNVSGCYLRIDAYGNTQNGVRLGNSSGNFLSVLSQSNKKNGVQCSGWGNFIQGYTEFNTENGVLLDGNASGNMVNIVSFGENKINYNKGQLRTCNFTFIQDGDFTKGGAFRTSRIGLDNVSNLLSEVDNPTNGDLIYTSNGSEPLGKGIYKYDSAYGWIRLDGITFRTAPGTAVKGMDIHDTGDSRRKYYDGSKWNILSRFVPVPSAWNSEGCQGDWSADGNYLYICQSKNSWRRVALSSW